VVYSSVPAGYQTGYILAFFDVSEITETHEFSDSDFCCFFSFQKMGTGGSLILKF
jgi:hypothetical protein